MLPFYRSKYLKPFYVYGLLLTLLTTSCATLPGLGPLKNKKESPLTPPFRGAFHIHSRYSHDSSGSLEKIAKAAQNHGLDFVVITDHNNLDAREENSSRETRPLVIVGSEISTTDGHLIALGIDRAIETPVEPQKAIDQIHEQNGYAVLAHPVCDKTAWKDWDARNYDAMEIYNFACDFYASNKIGFVFKLLFLSPSFFIDHYIREPREALKQWDFLMNLKTGSQQPSPIPVGIGAVDAHMRYSLAFRAVTAYVNAKSLAEKDILKALISGNSYTVFESRGIAKDFKFEARDANQKFDMGSFIHSEIPVSLFIETPQTSEIRLIHDGKIIQTKLGKTLTFDVRHSGIYRVEVFRNGKMWIISNPITIG